MTEAGRRFLERIAPRPKPRHKRLELAHLLATTGMTLREIGNEIGWSEDTVKNQCQVIYQESGIGNRIEFIFWAIVNGIVDCPCGAGKCGSSSG